MINRKKIKKKKIQNRHQPSKKTLKKNKTTHTIQVGVTKIFI